MALAGGSATWCRLSLWLLDLNALVKLLSGRRHIIGRVEKAEVVRAESNLRHFRGHDWEVLHAWVVGESVGVPDDNVLVTDLVAATIEPGLDAHASQGLICVVTCREQLTILVFGDPDWALAELRSSPVPGSRTSKEHLGTKK